MESGRQRREEYDLCFCVYKKLTDYRLLYDKNNVQSPVEITVRPVDSSQLTSRNRDVVVTLELHGGTYCNPPCSKELRVKTLKINN